MSSDPQHAIPPDSDVIAFRTMLYEAGVAFSEAADRRGIEIVLEAKTGPNNEGFYGFAATFFFDPDSGALQRVRIEE